MSTAEREAPSESLTSAWRTVGPYSVRPEPLFHDVYGPAFVGTSEDNRRTTSREVWLRCLFRPAGTTDDDWERSITDFQRLLDRFRPLNGTLGFQPVVETVLFENQAWVVYEPVDGVPLRTFLRSSNRAQPLDWGHSLLRQIGAILDAAGRSGLIHGDITPDTLWVAPDGKSVTLTGFGLALLRDKMGSPYAAPEQWDGYEGDSRADVFGAGAVLYEALFGLPAFSGAAPTTIALQLQEAPPKNIPTASNVVRDVLLTMLAYYPTRRYGRVSFAAEDLRLHQTPTGIATVRLPPDPDKIASVALLTVNQNTLTSLILTSDGEMYPRLDFLNRVRPNYSFAEVAAMKIAPAPKIGPDGRKAGDGGYAEYAPDETDIIQEPTASVPTLIQRIREERRLRRERELREPIRERIRKVVTVVVTICVLSIPVFAAAALREAYRYATITDIAGSAVNGYSADLQALHVGERLDPTDPSRSAIQTRADSSVLVTLHDACLKVGPSSQIEILDMDYPVGSAPVRRFALRHGYVAFAVNPQHHGAIFDVVCRGVHFVVHGTAFRVGTVGSRGVSIQTAEGAVRVTHGDSSAAGTTEVRAGSQLTMTAPGSGASSIVTATQEPFSGPGFSALQRLGSLRPSTNLIGAAYENWESSSILPLMDSVVDLFKGNAVFIKKYMDPKNVASAKLALGEIGKLIYTSSEESVPATLNLSTLEELSMTPEDRTTYLSCFKDGRLFYYHRLAGNGYEIAAYANDTENTLIVVRNGKAIVKKDE